MARTGNHPHQAHPCECRRQAEQDTEHYVCDCTRIFPAFDQADGLHTESGESRESATKANDQQRPEIIVGLNIHELPDEDSYEKAARNVYEQGAERKSVGGEVLYSAAYQIPQDGARGASKCD